MGSEWKDCELGDVIEFKRGYDLPKTIRGAGDIPVISSSGKSGFHNEFKVMAPGVVTGRYGTIGEVFYLDTNFWPLNTTLYVCDFKGNDPLFIYYFLKTISYSDFIDKAAVPGINRNHIHKAKVKVPKNIDCQQKIAKTLKVLDNKISLNNQINQTLEQMAQTLFKSWFVDFDPVIDNALDVGFFERDLAFPKELLRRVEVRKVAREGCGFKSLPEDICKLFPAAFEECAEPSLGLGGWVPEGWNIGCISDVAHYRSKRIETSELTLTNYISTENMLSDKKGIQQAASLPTVNSVPAYTSGTVLISNIRPYFKKIWLAKGDGGYSNDVLGFEVNDLKTESYLFNLMYQDTFFDFMMATSKGSKMPRGDKKAILGWNIVVPPLILRIFFSEKVSDFYTVGHLRDHENTILTNLRDTLLPKLISGELSLSDINIDSVDGALA
ncbi:restriction endonuclease subunit S [Morganella morganii]|uniref:restriction endonuclease subunit S n=1 Tax=Morganella morganii TaxID=582 RepID=UPI001BD99610|nr:restriction endonuclease subunit S [Morganella morganii]EKU0269126.1 restriction endonuclease subunit S [Morganella morganii]ELF0883207.1 restriction endonuclease subunit S [Morganella morganii]MBT0388329.1 restriction endonuclease subunit S [Morganella morganii subsp. morganii]MBT0520187.1 restriction endonuclease subunit S [Morganella morganii subsp. morganii]QWL88421.1 restriction endonuclease subunit S [Morganella morganii subsp. morganii]